MFDNTEGNRRLILVFDNVEERVSVIVLFDVTVGDCGGNMTLLLWDQTHKSSQCVPGGG